MQWPLCSLRLQVAAHALLPRRSIKRPPVNTSQLKEGAFILPSSSQPEYERAGRRVGALAMKVGMLAIFDRWGQRHAVTVLHLDECQVVQKKTVESDGYTALQVGQMYHRLFYNELAWCWRSEAAKSESTYERTLPQGRGAAQAEGGGV